MVRPSLDYLCNPDKTQDENTHDTPNRKHTKDNKGHKDKKKDKTCDKKEHKVW